mmetsp:Transcript_22102/g.66361  ORF Transcript_22102/g.66361 Transcript_22102/m.66361 type:complete len:310 (+) Transcript_22102:232-1161(+)
MAAPNQQAQQLALMEPGEAAATAVAVLARATVNTAKAHPKITGSWALGLILVAFATGFKVTEGQHQAYDAGMQAADMSAPIGAAAARLREAEQLRYQASGFFSCDARCQHYKARAAAARAELDDLQRRELEGFSDVKRGVGVLSEYGVAETRDSFWRAFQGGKGFAKRQSMWDLLFTGLRYSSRDESTASVVLRWLVQLLFNFTIGLVGALVIFLWRLWGLVNSYQPDPVSALVFSMAAALAATAMVATYLFAMYFCAASGVAAVGAAAAAQARIEGQRRQDPRYRMQSQAYGHGGQQQQQPRYRPRNY